MNKSKLIPAVIGGVFGLLILVMAFLVWQAYGAKNAALEGDDEEGTDGLETVVEKARSLSRKPIYPCAESVKAVQSNTTLLVSWKDDAIKLASRGDRVYSKISQAQFKEFLINDAKRLAALPGDVQGVLVKPDFAFGPFKEYISEGKMPTEARMPVLQRNWDDVTTVVEALAAGGISELLDIQVKAKEEPKEDTSKRGRKNAKGRGADKEAASGPSSHTYVFTFKTRHAGFVKVLNALSTGERFTVVDTCSIIREKDAIAEALGGDEKKQETQRSGRRGRRRGAVQQQDESAEKKDAKGGIITDPLADEPFKVELTVTVYDFRSLEDAEKAEEVKK